ncbi:hypothetical protein PR202_gb18704 [Eleusine coracana subsp. coracana]|uniref:Thioredoxin domain-containing protein n=1 Tax=Eleusine coracana subsp. coracana TaxID=191504 RepID=A0AAV5F433_ELECO|nr:hypothetical protein PR202_gb18704 [Eleusine coracana subsp. coracana]
MKANMKNIKSQEDLDEQLLMAGDNLTVVQFFSPRCPACKALHPKVRQYAGIHPELQFLLINCDEHREIGQSHNIHVLPMFRFYRGAEGRICSFSCTIATIHKFKAALKRHGVQTANPAAEKSLAKFDPERVDSSTDVPNKIQTENLTEEKGLAKIGPESIDSSTDVPNKTQAENLTEEKGLGKI